MRSGETFSFLYSTPAMYKMTQRQKAVFPQSFDIPYPLHPTIRFMHWQAATNMEYFQGRQRIREFEVLTGEKPQWWLACFFLADSAKGRSNKPAYEDCVCARP